MKKISIFILSIIFSSFKIVLSMDSVSVQGQIQENNIKVLNTINDFYEVLKTPGLSVIKACSQNPNCVALAPKFEVIAKKYKDRASFFIISSDASDLIKYLSVVGFPTILFYKDGLMKPRLQGYGVGFDQRISQYIEIFSR